LTGHLPQVGGGAQQGDAVDLFVVLGAITMPGQPARDADQNRQLCLERQIAID
jgi:hypothetical protein